MIALLGDRSADVLTPNEIGRALGKLAIDRKLSPVSVNRYKPFLSLAYRLGMENSKVNANPVRLVRRKREGDGRVRWLAADEEKRLRAVIGRDYPDQPSAFVLSIHTGMRMSEQHRMDNLLKSHT